MEGVAEMVRGVGKGKILCKGTRLFISSARIYEKEVWKTRRFGAGENIGWETVSHSTIKKK